MSLNLCLRGFINDITLGENAQLSSNSLTVSIVYNVSE